MKVAKVLTVFLVVMALISCSSIQQIKQNWQDIKADEKARIICEFIQSELEITFDTAKNYVVMHPQFQADWKAKVVPAFDVANKTLASYMILAKANKVTFIDVGKGMVPMLQPILAALGAWGVDISNLSKFTAVIGG